MWIYYNCNHGPGHQGSSYGFKHFADEWTMEDIEEHLCEYFYRLRFSNIVLEFWKVDRPPSKYYREQKKTVQAKINSLKKQLKILDAAHCFVPEERDGLDDTLQRNLTSRVEEDFVRRLHKVGLMYDGDDVRKWWRGERHPTEPKRTKILQILRRTKKYSD